MADRRDLVFGSGVEQVQASTAVTGGENSSSVNMSDNYAVKFIINADDVGTDLVIKLQESVDDSVWTDVDASEVVSDQALTSGQLTIPATGGDNTANQIGYVGFKQYVRYNVVSGAGTISGVGETSVNIYCEA